MNNGICLLRLVCLLCLCGIAGSLASACGASQGLSALPGSARGAGTDTAAIKERDMQLIAAAERGDLEAVRQLLLQGANLQARDSGGRTALVAAAYGNQVAVADVLIRAGADVNAQDNTQQSAYLIATSEVGDDPRLLNLTKSSYVIGEASYRRGSPPA